MLVPIDKPPTEELVWKIHKILLENSRESYF